MALTPEKIAELYANKRTKGLYEDKLSFLMTESDEPGIDPAETWPMEFGKKNATTLYQGFRNAAEKLEILDQVDVIQRDSHVFVLVKSRVALLLGTDETEADENSEVSEDSEQNEVVEATEDNVVAIAQ